MGTEWSSCCSVEQSGEKQVIKDGEPSQKPATPKASERSQRSRRGDTGAEAVDVEKFQRKLENSMDVIVLLADGTRLTCQLKLNVEDKFLAISCEKNVRVIHLTDLKAVLHGRDQLKRVETKATLVDDPNCVALHMVTGNCIPVRFDAIDDKKAFVELMKKMKN